MRATIGKCEGHAVRKVQLRDSTTRAGAAGSAVLNVTRETGMQEYHLLTALFDTYHYRMHHNALTNCASPAG